MIKKEIFTVLNLIEEKGYQAFLVGGAVRNYLLGMPISDYDVCTNADPNAIKLIFSNYTTYDIGKKHGTVTVLINKVKIDITPYRSEANYTDHRHPSSVSFSNNLKEDLLRRDFTINALCMDKNKKIIDLFDGIKDLNNKTIRAIGNPHTRFNEDGLRILRALRFKAKLDFKIEEKTNEELFKCKKLLKYISEERKKDELLQILECESAFKLINDYLEIFNTFIGFKHVTRKKNDFSNCLYSLAYLCGKAKKIDLLKLKYSHSEIDLINHLIDAANINPNNDYEFISCLSNIYQKDTLKYLQELHHKDYSQKYKKLKKYIVTINELKITGKDIETLGYKGKQIGIIKNELLDLVHHKKLNNTKLSLSKYLKKYYNN